MAEAPQSRSSAVPGTDALALRRERLQRVQSVAADRRVLILAWGASHKPTLLTGCRRLVHLHRDFASTRKARLPDPDGLFTTGNFQALPFAAGSFDVVVCLEGLDHLYLPEVRRVLASGGLLLGAGRPSVRAALERHFAVQQWTETAGPLGAECWTVAERLATAALPGVSPLAPLRRWVQTALWLVHPTRARAKWRNVLLFGKMRLNATQRRRWDETFDPAGYLAANPDLAAAAVHPRWHYLLHGYREGRRGYGRFNADFYLRRHPDIHEADVNPLLHWVLFGADENRTAVPVGLSPAELSGNPPPPRLNRQARTGQREPLVSVVIPCFNYGRFLAEAIASVQAQTFTNWELIVVEGGSTDGTTPAVVRALESQGLPRTRFLYRDRPCLAGDNRNHGIGAARGRYVVCLDADDLLQPTYLETALYLAEAHSYDVVYPSVQCFGEADTRWLVEDAVFPEIARDNQISTVALFRRAAWEAAGGYRDWGKGGEHVAEDWEFWVRLLGHGYAPKSIRRCLMQYRVHGTSLSQSGERNMDLHRRALAQANADLLRDGPRERPLAETSGWGALLPAAPAQSAVLFLLPHITIGGAELIFEMIARDLVARGQRVIVVTTQALPDPTLDNTAHFETITPYVYPLPELLEEQEHRWPDFLSYLINAHAIDLVYMSGCDFAYGLLPDLHRVYPAIAVVDQLFNDQTHFPTNRHYAELIDVTLVPSDPFAQRVVQEFGEDPGRVAVIPHGVAIPPVPGPEARQHAIANAGLPAAFADKFLVGFFGRLSPEKAPGDFVEIVRRLADDPSLAFVMTGEGPESEAVHRLIKRYKLGNRIHTPGFVDRPRDLMAAVDVIVVPSRLDGMPLVVMEGQALCRSVVASHVGSIPAMITHGESGLLCTPGDVAEFVRQIRELQGSPELRSRLGRAARESVERHHGAATMNRRYAEVFEQARARRSKLQAAGA